MSWSLSKVGWVWSGSHSRMLASVSLFADSWVAVTDEYAGFGAVSTWLMAIAARVASMLRCGAAGLSASPACSSQRLPESSLQSGRSGSTIADRSGCLGSDA